MKGYPYRSQERKATGDVIISAKLFDTRSSATWWLSEYDPENKIAFCYVTGLFEDEWGNTSIAELEDLVTVINTRIGKPEAIPRIEIDEFFEPTKFSDLPIHKESTD
jgi:hypothetical protein